MNFTSQISTTKEQSERLLALGLKKETADCVVSSIGSKDRLIHTEEPIYVMESLSSKRIPNYPAWSLHRLIEMMPSFIDIGEYDYMLRIIQGRAFSYRSNIAGYAFLYGNGGVYNSAIYTIEWLIGEGYFNKEYLE